MANTFKLHIPFAPAGGQPQAIKKLKAGRPGRSTLVGVTGSGKTYTMAHVIAAQDKPVLILAPNKTLAAQLYEEFSLFFLIAQEFVVELRDVAFFEIFEAEIGTEEARRAVLQGDTLLAADIGTP